MSSQKARKIIKLKKSLAQAKYFGFIKTRLMHKNLWRFSYDSVAKAFMIGMFWMMIPMPFQMVPAVFMCVYLRANTPLAIACVWISNPFTWLPIFFTNFIFGSYLLGMDVEVVGRHGYAIYVVQHVDQFWKPLYLGSVLGGIILGGLCYCGVYIFKWIRNYSKKNETIIS